MVLGALFSKAARAMINQNSFMPPGFGSEGGHIDSQVTLKIPEGHADAVYNYLKSKYASWENNHASSSREFVWSGKKCLM